MEITYKRPDGSFVGVVNGFPYHITSEDPLYEEAQELGANAPFEPGPPTLTPEQLLAAERATMNPFYTAFRFAMKATPATGFAHLLDKVTATVAAARAQDPFSDIVIWNDSVTQVVRTHPDMTAFRVLFGLSETQLDDLCRLAMQIEVGS